MNYFSITKLYVLSLYSTVSYHVLVMLYWLNINCNPIVITFWENDQNTSSMIGYCDLYLQSHPQKAISTTQSIDPST